MQERQEGDRRSYNIVLTKEGKDFLDRVEDFGDEMVTFIQEALSEEEAHCFASMCRKITNLYTEKQ